PRDFVARLVPPRFALLVFRNPFAPLAVQLAEGVQVQSDAPPAGQLGENFGVLAKIAQIMHGFGRITQLSRGARIPKTPQRPVSRIPVTASKLLKNNFRRVASSRSRSSASPVQRDKERVNS